MHSKKTNVCDPHSTAPRHVLDISDVFLKVDKFLSTYIQGDLVAECILFIFISKVQCQKIKEIAHIGPRAEVAVLLARLHTRAECRSVSHCLDADAARVDLHQRLAENNSEPR
jgi:hypothetical protein